MLELALTVLSWVFGGGYKLLAILGAAAWVWRWVAKQKGKARAEVHEADRIADRKRAREAALAADDVDGMSDAERDQLLMAASVATADSGGSIVVPGTPRHRARLHARPDQPDPA